MHHTNKANIMNIAHSLKNQLDISSHLSILYIMFDQDKAVNMIRYIFSLVLSL